MACREFLGTRGWCQGEPTVWLDNEGFCGHHGLMREVYKIKTLERTRGGR